MIEVAKLLEIGAIKSKVSLIFPFEEMAEAHKIIEIGRSSGKSVLNL